MAATRAPPKLGKRVVRRHGPLVDTIVRHGRVRVGNRNDAGLDRNLVAGQAVRVAVAVPALVVVADGRCRLREPGDAPGDPFADLGVLAHQHPLLLAQLTGSPENGVRKRHLSEIVQPAGQPTAHDRLLGEPQLGRDGAR